jgi:hypothetical protein
VTCPDYKWCKERLGLDPTHRQHGFEPLCIRCFNFDYEADQQERLAPEPLPETVSMKELHKVKDEVNRLYDKFIETDTTLQKHLKGHWGRKQIKGKYD